MRFNISFQDVEPNVALPIVSQSQNAAKALEVARTAIEHQLDALAKQYPRLLYLALNEAESLAWQSGYPELVFPVLAQEKAGEVASWHARQKSVWANAPIQAFAA